MTNIRTKNPDGSDERDFLHSMASPLTTAYLTIDLLLEAWQSREESVPTEMDHLIAAHMALEEIKILLQNRRQLLIDCGVPSSTASLKKID